MKVRIRTANTRYYDDFYANSKKYQKQKKLVVCSQRIEKYREEEKKK